MTITTRLSFLILVILVLTWSCTRPISIGSEFLEDEKSDLLYKDDFGMTLHTETTDSILTHSSNVSLQLVTYLCGNVNDPVFGKYKAEIYAQPVIGAIASELKGAVLDSVVLQLRYDSLGTYGYTHTPVTLTVRRMTENPSYETDYYSNHRFAVSDETLGSYTFTPNITDSVNLIFNGDTLLNPPLVRIPMNVNMFTDFTTQPDSVYTNIDDFLSFFNGIQITMSDADNSMLGFNLTSTVSGLIFYYDTDTLQDRVFKFIFSAGAIRSEYLENDYSGTVIASSLTPDPEEDYWFLQGMAGVRSYMNVDGLETLQNAVINSALLEVYATYLDGDEPSYYSPCPFIVTQEKTDSTLVNSIDVRSALNITLGGHTSNTYLLLYDGMVQNHDPGPPQIFRYEMKVTNQIKEIIKGNQGNVIYFNPFSKGNLPNRAVFFGPNNPVYAPRLRVYYTAL